MVLKVEMWSNGSRIPSYESNEGILNLEGRGWLLMEVMKRESVQWTKSSTWFVLLIFSLISSMTLLIWSISLSKCGTLREAVPLKWFSYSTFSHSLTSWLWACPSVHRSWHCGTPWVVLVLNIFSFFNFLTLSLPFRTSFMTLPPLVNLLGQFLILTD